MNLRHRIKGIVYELVYREKVEEQPIIKVYIEKIMKEIEDEK